MTVMACGDICKLRFGGRSKSPLKFDSIERLCYTFPIMKHKPLLLALIVTILAAGCARGPLAWLGARLGGTTHTVLPGDTLSDIAALHGTTADELVRVNAAAYPSLSDNPALLRVGWELTIPGQGVTLGAVTHRVDSDLANSTGGSANKVSRAPAVATDDELRAVEQEIIRLTNEARRSEGLPELEVDPALMEIARERAQQVPGNYSHYGPNGEALCRQLASQRGYGNAGSLAENIGSGPKMSESGYGDMAFTNSWLTSSSHRANIMHPDMRHIGVGVYCGSSKLLCHGVQLFAP